jgi:hypothetical protein
MYFNVRYYLVAILFILFDLEVAFVFPWAVVQSQLGWFGFIGMSIFLSLLVRTQTENSFPHLACLGPTNSRLTLGQYQRQSLKK